jgi:hypothetical protein
MKFWRLTLGFGLLGAAILATYAGVTWTDACSGGDSLQLFCYSRGDVMVYGGIAGLLLGAAVGLGVWALWRLASWWIGLGYDDGPDEAPNAYKRKQV